MAGLVLSTLHHFSIMPKLLRQNTSGVQVLWLNESHHLCYTTFPSSQGWL